MIDKLRRALLRIGGTHTVDDVVADVKGGLKQGFTHGESWVVTQIVQYPQFKALEIWMYVGEKKDIDELYLRVVAYAKQVGATKLRTFARKGWDEEFVKSFGFKRATDMTLYQEDV